MNILLIPRGHVSSPASQERIEKYEKCKQYLEDYQYIQKPTQEDVHKYLGCGGEITSPSVGEVFAVLGSILLVCLVVAIASSMKITVKEKGK